MLAVTLTDNKAVPTGFTAMVAGSGSAAVSLYAAPADEPFAGIAWGLVGSRTGDGSIAVTCPPGFLFVTAKTSTDCSLPKAFAVTDGQDCPGVRCQAAVAARLKLASLDGIGDNVHEQFLPDATVLRYPCAVVHWAGAVENEESGLNGLDYVAFPIQVHFYDAGFKSTKHDVRRRYLNWRDAAGKAFRHQRLAGVPESAWCDVPFGPVVDPRAEEEASFYLGAMTVRAVCRLPRGLGA